MNNYVLAVDIGNTNTHIGLVNCSSRKILSLEIFPSTEIDARIVDSLVVFSQSMKHVAPVPVVISSVIGSIEERFAEKLALSIEGQIFWLHYHPSLPLTLHYESPSVLGPDRLANFIYGYSVFSDRDLIIISAGTTITVDYLKTGREFMGGAILPGFLTQLKSLHEHTAGLPLVTIEEIDYEFPGQSTKSCMVNGARWGIAGSLSFLVGKYRDLFNGNALVLTTGGSWKYLQEHVTFAFEFIPELTLVGCALYYTLLQGPDQKPQT